MFKRLMILWDRGARRSSWGQLPLGLHPDNQVARRARAAGRTYWSTFNAIEQFGAHPDKGTEHAAKAALTKPTKKA